MTISILLAEVCLENVSIGNPMQLNGVDGWHHKPVRHSREMAQLKIVADCDLSIHIGE